MKTATLLFVLLCGVSFSQTTNYYDSNGNKIGSSKVVTTPEDHLDKMIEQQSQQLLQQPLVDPQYSVDQKLKEYNDRQFQNQYNERDKEIKRRMDLVRKLEAELKAIENDLKTKSYSSEVRMMLQSDAQRIRNQISDLYRN